MPSIRLGRLSHVHAVAPHKPVDQRGGAIAAAAAGHATGKTGQGLLRQQVLLLIGEVVEQAGGAMPYPTRTVIPATAFIAAPDAADPP